MKLKGIGLLMISLIVCAMFSGFLPSVQGWSSAWGLNSHGEMARDTLEGLGWTTDQIGNIPDYASVEEYEWYTHRIEERQEAFLSYKCGHCGTCKECTDGSLGGAELGAKSNIAVARMYYESGNIAEGQEYLGYAIHFIQDSVCPAHVFPFQIGWLSSSTHFEWHAAYYYGSRDWSLRIEASPITPIVSSDDLVTKIVQAAETVLGLPCSYKRADGENVADERVGDVPLNGWRMSEEDIGLCMAKAASLVKGAAAWATGLQKGVVRNFVPTGLAKIDLEEGTEGQTIKSTIAGLRFTTTLGYDWLYCDIRTGSYNARSLTDTNVNYGSYVVNGYFAGWLGVNAGQGRIDFLLGSASYFSLLTSTYSGLRLDAYDSDDNLIATSGWVEGNLYTYTFTRLTVMAEGIAYVLIHDTGNYWEIDDIVTDAPSWGCRISSTNIQKIPQRIELKLNEGSWTVPGSEVEIDIYDIGMRTLEYLTELTPQPADDLVGAFSAILEDRNHDGKISLDEILENIQDQIPEEIANTFRDFILQRIYAMNLEPPSPDYGQNLLNQVMNFATGVLVRAEAVAPYAIVAAIFIPVSISTGFTNFGIAGYQAMTGIYIPTNALLGTNGEITAAMYSHGDFTITDSEGRILCKEFSQIPGGTYIEVDLNLDGSPDDIAVLPASTEDYTINIIPDIDVDPDDTFTLTMANLGMYFELVKDLHFSDIPEFGYGLQASMPTTDLIPPSTTLTIGEPNYVASTETTFITQATSLTLEAQDNVGGSGLAATGYRVYNATYNSGWTSLITPIEFDLAGLAEGLYSIDYNSTDNAGNVETTQMILIYLDSSGPLMIVENPPPGWALQDGVTFIALANDASGTHSLDFSIREANGDQGIPVGFEDVPANYNPITGKWDLFFNTLQLLDGNYVVLVKAEDNLGQTASITVPYSIRNWAVLERLPSTPNSNAGRTMPVKFSLRVAASVDPNQPFVYNEELTVKIYKKASPSNILLQTSTLGTTSKDYRIDSVGEKYITNFQTLSTPATYVVEIYRKDMLIGTFEFKTVSTRIFYRARDSSYCFCSDITTITFIESDF